MKKDSFLTIASMCFVVIIFLVTKAMAHPENTTIIYTTKQDEYSIQENSSKTNSSDKKQKGTSTNKKDNNGNSGNKENIDDNKNDSNELEFDEDIFDVPKEDSSDTESSNDKDNSTSTETSDNENSQSSDSTSDDVSEITYNDLLKRIYKLNNNGINVFINWHEDIATDKYGVIDDIKIADSMLKYIENTIDLVHKNYFSNLDRMGYKTQILLISDKTQNVSYVESSINKNNTITYLVNGEKISDTDLFFNAMYEINTKIISKSKFDLMKYKVNSKNPSDFTYGVINQGYIDKNYFLNALSQKSIDDDCKTIFTKYYSKQINLQKYQGTALYDKINYVRELFDKEVFY